ncbi:MAG: membrane protein insertase YidC [Pseudomonadota bacterium]
MDNRRSILLLVFFFSLFMLWDAWQKYNQPKLDTVANAQSLERPAIPQPLFNLKGSGVFATKEVQSVAPVRTSAAVVNVKTDLYSVDISSLGGDITQLELNAYKSIVDKTKNFSLFEAKHHYLAQSGFTDAGLPNHKTVFSVVPGQRDFSELDKEAKTLELRLIAPAVDGVQVEKIYTFTRGSYLIDVAYEINNGGEKTLTPYAYFQLQRDDKAPDGENMLVSTFTGAAVYTEQDKYKKIKLSDFSDKEKNCTANTILPNPAKAEKVVFSAQADNGFLAMVQHYFVAAWLPKLKTPREYYVRTVDDSRLCSPEGELSSVYSAGVIVPTGQIAAGAKTKFSMPLYAGPQIQSVLEHLAQPSAEGGLDAKGLPLVVDYGWLTIVAAPIFWCLEAIHKLIGNWGWAIVLLTIAIKAIFYPLSAASYKSMAKMRQLTPRLIALKERHANDRPKLHQEMMEIYKREKINPLGGCLPMLVQIPVFVALYWALLGAVEMRDAPWLLWIKDLSSPDPFYVLPVLMVITMLIQTKLNPTPPDPIQAKVMMMMPFIFGGMFFFFPAGLVIYWVVNNILSIAQQWQITRVIEGAGASGKAANDPRH